MSVESQESGATETRNETRPDRAPRGEGRRERGEGRRERGGERGERRNEGGRQNVAGENAQTEMAFNADATAAGQNEAGQANEERQDGTTGAPEKRERRSRDRYGRDRRERNTSNDSAPAENTSAEASPTEASDSEGASAPRSYFDRGNQQASAETASPVSATSNAAEQKPTSSSTATTTMAAQAPAGLPKVQAYELPMASLIQVAEGSGLQWVNSDPEKIAQVQAAIAAEPKPVHVPRERPPAVVFDEGPLILVETRKDLSDMKLPF